MKSSACSWDQAPASIRPDATAALGRELAKRGITCIYGGSCSGLMSQLAESVLEAGGEIVGVTVAGIER